MTKRIFSIVALVLVAVMALWLVGPPMQAAPTSPNQILLSMKFAKAGPQAQGAGVLQTAEVNTMSAAIATATLTEVVAAPSSGSIYLRGLLVEKSTGAGGTITLKTGTGTNCGTGGATLLGPITNPPIGYIPIGIPVTAAKALCLQTDAATTSVRALTN